MAPPNFPVKKPSTAISSLYFLSIAVLFCCCLSTQAKISYPEHCNSIVPQVSISGLTVEKNRSVYISIWDGYYTGGDNILTPANTSSSSSSSSSWKELQPIPGHFNFYSSQPFRTQNPDLYHISGSHLSIQGEATPSFWPERFPKRRYRFSTIYGSSLSANFEVSGFWDRSSGKLCMVGTGSSWTGKGRLKLSAVFVMNHPKESNIYTCVVNGTIKSLDDSDSSNHFDTISVLAYAENNYIYTQLDRVRDICSRVKVPTNLLGLETDSTAVNLQQLLGGRFQLEYAKDCSSLNCGPFSVFMTMSSVYCTEDGKVHMHVGFTNSSSDSSDNILIPEKSLVAEGYWDEEKKILCLLACPVLKTQDVSKDSWVGDCTIGLHFWFPSVYTISVRSNVLGRIWSVKGKSDPGFFSPISFQSVGQGLGILHGVKYEYTIADSMAKTCGEIKHNQSLRYERYPDENSIADLTFDLTVKGSGENTMSGYAIPLSFGENFYGDSFSKITSEVTFGESNPDITRTLWNVSYMISYSFYNSTRKLEEITDISAEGVYNARTGTFCMVGCKSPSYLMISTKGKGEDSVDCQIQINIQLSPLNFVNGEELNGNFTGTRHLNGTISSKRTNSDPLYFDPLELLSYTMYDTEAGEVVKRMDMEIIMVLISLTLSCVFIVFQIFYVRKRKGVLPSMSIAMLVIMAIGNIVPLVLNFNALFARRLEKQQVMLYSGGWLEVNEVLVRVMSMLALLLQIRLLQLSFVARSSEERKQSLRIAEKKALKYLLPVYFAGALIVWFVRARSFNNQDFVSYGGLIIDGFLLPQIILNLICESKDKALSPVFYVGTTALRVLPHLYDAYRARFNVPYFNFSYIYASPNGDYFSTTWDIIIPLQGVIFAVIIFLQQKYGGGYLVPRFRKPGGYVTVPAIDM